MKSFKTILILGLIFLGVSCSKMEYTQELNPTYPVSGDWTITVTAGTDSYGPYYMKIYNTSASKDSIWIDDNGTFWDIKAKAKVDMKNLTFAAADAQNEYYDSQVTFTEGKVIGKDSINFKVTFSDDSPANGTVYTFAGHRKLSYEEYMDQ